MKIGYKARKNLRRVLSEPTGKNEEMGLPFSKMKEVTIAVDIDGTLRCNCTSTCQDPNEEIVALVKILSKFKNTKLIACSGGGKDYAYSFIRRFKLEKYISESRCHSKLNYTLKHGSPDIAIDDIQDTGLGRVNLIVRCK